jgi:hypothetical protein
MDDKELVKGQNTRQPAGRRRGVTIVGIVAILITLALALGLGLGLGLKKKHSSSTSSVDSISSLNVQPWRQSTLEYDLSFSDWDLNAPPQTRSYNFTVSEININPDGTIAQS